MKEAPGKETERQQAQKGQSEPEAQVPSTGKMLFLYLVVSASFESFQSFVSLTDSGVVEHLEQSGKAVPLAHIV